MTIRLSDVKAAAHRISEFVWHTPLVHSAWLSDLLRADVWLKLENVQTTGSFKLRGAVNALAVLRERQPELTTVVAASAGNHGLAVAWAGQQMDIHVRVYLPQSAPAAKRLAIARLGAEAIETPSYEAAEAGAHDDAIRTGAVYVSPYDDPDVIAGAGTVAHEMLVDRSDLETIVVPLGGGGLLAGTAIVARARPIGPRTIGAELQASPVFTAALASGRVVPVLVRPTLADGLAGNMEPESRTFGLVRDLVDRVVLVSESAIETAMRGLITEERLIAEGAGATGVAALLQGNLGLEGKRVGVIVSGRNVDGETLRGILA